jgi:hypothetical protein
MRDRLALLRLYLDSKDMKNKFIDYLKEEIIQHMETNQKNLLTLPELSMLKLESINCND